MSPAILHRVTAPDGLELAVHVWGEGPPVLILHGFPDDHSIWRHQIGALVSAGYKVIAPDNRGCGESAIAPTESAYKANRLVDDVLAVMDHFGISACPLIGHDWGAVIGWQAVLTAPRRFTRFAAFSVGHPACYAGAPLRQKLMAWYILFFQLRGFAEWVLRAGNWRLLRGFDRSQEAENWISKLSRPGRLTAALSIYRANFGLLLRRDWPPVQVPVFGIWSDGDVALCREQMTRSQAYAPRGWQYAELPGASHWLQLDRPGEVNNLIRSFLEEWQPAA